MRFFTLSCFFALSTLIPTPLALAQPNGTADESTSAEIMFVSSPMIQDVPEPEIPVSQVEVVHASYYGHDDRFHGQRTANGERFDAYGMTAAHKTLPFGTRLRVTNEATGRSVVVRINDRGPFIPGRQLDLSYGAAREIGLVQRGHGQVTTERL